MIDIKNLLTTTKKKTVLISTPTEYKDSVLLDTLSTLNLPNTLVIYNGSRTHDQLDIVNPKKTIDRMHHNDYHYIFIVNVYSFDKDHGHHIEYILQFRPGNTRVVYFAQFCNFVAISEWLDECKIINYDSSVSFSVIGYEDSKNDFGFEVKLNYKIHPFINKQTIIYCATQKMCKISAEHVLKDFCKLSKKRILEMEFDSSDLQSCALFGIGYVKNDLCDSDKVNIIKLYNAKRIEILFLHKYVEDLGADTYIFKSTKTYKELEYQERQAYEIVGMCRSAYKNAKIYIMTTKSMHKFYKDVFGSKLGLDYKDVVGYAKQPFAVVPYYKFSSVEHHMDEYILYIMLYSKNYNYKEYIKKSFFYHCLGPKKLELDIDLLVSEIVDSLAINRIITSSGTCKNAINTDLVNVFVNNDIPFNLFTKLIGIVGSEASIIAQISELPEVKIKLHSKIKYSKNEDLFAKLTHNIDLRASAFGIEIKNYVKICLDIKLLLGQNIGKVAYLNSILNSTIAQKRYLDYQNIQDDSFSTYDIDLAIKSDRCIIKINNDKQYHCVVEKSNILLHEKIFYNNYNCMLENDTIIYCICITDNSLSAVLKYENGCLNIVHKYYRASIKNYVSKPKTTRKIENVKKVKYTEEYRGVKIEFAAPLNITLPEWFSK